MMIRIATLDDAQAIADLHTLSWRNTYRGILSDAYLDGPVELERQTFWKKSLANSSNLQHVLVAENSEQQISGFICIALKKDPTYYTLIDNLHVTPQLKGSGIGTTLLEEASLWLQLKEPHHSIYLWVLSNNDAAHKFYQNLNAKIIEVCPQPQVDGRMVTSTRYLWQTPKHLKDAITIKQKNSMYN